MIKPTDGSGEIERQKIAVLSEATREPLVHCNTVWPFVFFPDTVSVDKNKIEIVYGLFFFSKHLFQILIQDLRTAHLSTGLFFATLTFEIIGYEQNPREVTFLPKQQATTVHRIIIGLMAAKREGIEIEELSDKEVYQSAWQIGKGQTDLNSAI
jgi:hypothetical protein